eukprot:TRINITY_DN5104_c0_g1_i1.p1 TRINITY_DN5104_c0_g1~~TRINITY_DN5104_c0_g1_i1.p1  ORF type:complete len:298 (-),score=61.25 TRINITY_DN5104_c0_g1_i1:45-938(-)
MSFGNGGSWGSPRQGFDNRGDGRNEPQNEYKKLLELLESNLRQINFNVSKINTNANKVGTRTDSQTLRRTIIGSIESTRALGTNTTQVLRKFCAPEIQDEYGDKQEKKRKVARLKEDLERALTRFKDSAEFASDKITNSPSPRNEFASGSGGGGGGLGQGRHYDSDDDDNLELQQQNLLKRQKLLEVENDAEFQDAMIADREDGIRQIEKSILELNDIFLDLAHLVEEQDPMFNDIESNIVSSVTAVEKGVKDLGHARDYQKTGRNWMCILFIILGVFIAVVVIILAISLGVLRKDL